MLAFTVTVILSLFSFLDDFNPFESDFEKGMKFYEVGWDQLNDNKLDKALNSYLKAHYHLSKTNDIRKILSIKNDIGRIFQLVNNHNLAIKFYDEGIQISKNYRQRDFELMILFNKSIVLNTIGQREDALKLLQICTNSINETKLINYADVRQQMGLILSDIENYSEAIENYFSVINSSNQFGKDSIKYLGRAYHNIGDSYLQSSDYQKAKTYFEKAIYYKNMDGRNQVISIRDLGETQYMLGEYDEAVKNFELALDMTKDQTQVYMYIDIERLLSRCYDSLHMPVLARQHRIAFEDKILTHNQMNLDLNQEEQRLKSELIYYNMIQELQDQEYQKYYVIVIAAFTLLFAMIFWMVYKKMKKAGRPELSRIREIINLS